MAVIWLCIVALTIGTTKGDWTPNDPGQGLRCKGADDGCCTDDRPCAVNEGDCDHHSECAGNLVCGEDNCPWGNDDDCCEEPSGICVLRNQEYEGEVVKQIDHVKDWDVCLNNCYKNDDCWLWAHNNQTKKCFLKKTLTNTKSNNNAISGAKFCNPCPLSHPYAYLMGRYCCGFGYEDEAATKRITVHSKTCLYNNWYHCPVERCHDNEIAKGDKCLLQKGWAVDEGDVGKLGLEVNGCVDWCIKRRKEQYQGGGQLIIAATHQTQNGLCKCLTDTTFKNHDNEAKFCVFKM